MTERFVLAGNEIRPAPRHSGAIVEKMGQRQSFKHTPEENMGNGRKVDITCAGTGAIHTPSMSPYLPITPDEIVKDALAAAEAGAAVLHLHARNPENGRPDQTPEAFARFLPRIKQQTNAVINITSGGSPFMTVEER